MLISATKVLDYIGPEANLAVRDGAGNLLFTADFQRIRELADAMQVCGNVRGTRLRYLELIVPLAETVQKTGPQRASAGCKGQDSQTTYRGRDELALTYGHAFAACASYGGSAKLYRDMVRVGIS